MLVTAATADILVKRAVRGGPGGVTTAVGAGGDGDPKIASGVLGIQQDDESSTAMAADRSQLGMRR
jgi:hypothetical protein